MTLIRRGEGPKRLLAYLPCMTPDPKFHKCTTNLDNHGKFSPLDNGETIERPLYECCNNKDTILEFQDKLFFEIIWNLCY